MENSFLTQPYLLSLAPSREMNVVWIQRTPAGGGVEYGSSHALGRYVEAECFELTGLRAPGSPQGYLSSPEKNPPMKLWQCIARIGGLSPGERVYYRCHTGGDSTCIYDFHAAPPGGRPFRFALISDLQGFLPCDETVYQIGLNKPDFILYSGDAAFYSWRADQWFDLNEPWQEEGARRRAFFPCLQQQGGAQLLPYCPLFFCPGNHEVDDLRVGTDKAFSQEDRNWSWSIFMQLFRPLYPEMDTSLASRRWYSADYGDLHITSLSIQRWAQWGAYEAPGWRLTDSIAPGSPQLTWLENDLSSAKTSFKWVIQHWHLLNKGTDVQPPLCQPVISKEGHVTYPQDHTALLMELNERYGVNAVSYGHSHVYERYFARGTHYIEAAYFGVCYRESSAPLHPSGLKPIVEDNSRQSFQIVERKTGGLFATGCYALPEPVVFDEFQIADENGRTVPPGDGAAAPGEVPHSARTM